MSKDNLDDQKIKESTDQESGMVDDLKDLVAKEDSLSATTFLIALLLAVSLMTSVYSVYSIISKIEDRTIPLVQCPVAYDLDSPVILPVIRESSILSKDKWVRGFIRKYIMHQFPRNANDAEPFMKYVSGRSLGDVKNTYERRIKNIDKFSELIKGGYLYSFYAKDIEDGKDIRIRRSGISEWSIEVDGFMVHQLSGNEVRTTPTLRYTVKTGPTTLDNAEGLYVTWSNQEEYKDPVSGEKL